MIYYKLIDIDYYHVAEQIKDYCLKNPILLEKGQGSWRLATDWILNHTDIKNLFSWKIDFIGIFVTYTNFSSIHIDNDSKPVRINFPILNCNNTETKYYKFKGNSNRIIQPNGITYQNIDSNNLIFVDSFELSQAIVMRVLEPHQVCVYHNNFPRVSCTVQFKENIEYLLT